VTELGERKGRGEVSKGNGMKTKLVDRRSDSILYNFCSLKNFFGETDLIVLRF
jgi:hypothetical protein